MGCGKTRVETGLAPSQIVEEPWLWEGHGFSRATHTAKDMGFSP
jgi:hypothetical protein